MAREAIGYIRVSTAQQGRSGLGLEAQQAALHRFAQVEGFDILATFTEIETGKGSDALDRRPKLADALKLARKRKAPVIVAAGVAFISFQIAGVPFASTAIRLMGWGLISSAA